MLCVTLLEIQVSVWDLKTHKLEESTMTKSMKLALTLGICLLSLQVVAQKGTGQTPVRFKAPATPKTQEGVTTQKSVGHRNENISLHQKSLGDLYKTTTERLKSPNRLQKMGGMDGGGGNALLCKDGARFSITLLDVYEAKELGLKIESKHTDFKEIIKDSLDNLKSVSPTRAAIYKAHIDKLLLSDTRLSNTQWVENKVMPVIDDVKLATFPHNCLLVQAAVQRPLVQLTVPYAKTYIINSDVFRLLSPIDKAALVLHEVLYRESIYAGHENSVFARHLVGIIMSGEIKKYTLATLNELYAKNGNLCAEQKHTGALQFRRYERWEGDRNCLNFVESNGFLTQNKVKLKTPQNWPKKTHDLNLEYSGSLVNQGSTGIFISIFAHPENVTPDLDSPIVVTSNPNGINPKIAYETNAFERFDAKGAFKFVDSEYSLPPFKFEGELTVGFAFNQGFQLRSDLSSSSSEDEKVDMFNSDPFLSVMRKISPESRKLGYRFEARFEGNVDLNSKYLKYVKKECSDVEDSCKDSMSFSNKALYAHDGSHFLLYVQDENSSKQEWIKVKSVTFEGQNVSKFEIY